MTAEIINLRQVRKDRTRERERTLAAAQRVRFGRTKADRLGEAQSLAEQDARLDGARRHIDPSVPNHDDDLR
jgi:Domain of unknown function (DUF4169)